MAIITKISSQIKNTERYNIFLDGVYAFSVDENVLIQYKLKKGKELSELEITQIQYEDEIRKALNSAIHYLSFRMRSEQEVQTHLQKKDWPEPVIEAVIQKLIEQRYINDLEFATAFVRTHVHSGKKGPMMMRRELKEKGLTDTNIEKALEEYSKEKQIDDAIKLGNKYALKNNKLSERMLKKKVEQYLVRRGFPFELISIAIEEIQYEKCGQEEWETLLKEAERADRRYSKYIGYEYKKRMQQALFRRGFSIDIINRYLDEKMGNEQ